MINTLKTYLSSFSRDEICLDSGNQRKGLSGLLILFACKNKSSLSKKQQQQHSLSNHNLILKCSTDIMTELITCGV